MTTASPDLDLAELIADTEGEIVRLVRDRDPSTHGLYEMVRYHLALDGKGGNGGKRVRPLLGLLAYASIAGDHRRALPGAAAVELGHNFSLVHDDIEDRDVERRHRATLWKVWGVAQAINTGDTLFTLATGTREAPDPSAFFALLEAAGDCVTRAIGHAVLSAHTVEAGGRTWRCYRDAFPTAFPASTIGQGEPS